jgi:hypothetical protein
LWTAQRQVHISCTYSSNQYRPETIGQLIERYLAGLRQLIATADVEYV